MDTLKLKHGKYEVEVKKMSLCGVSWFCSYVSSPAFGKMKNLAQGQSSCTYHEGCEVGFDTDHFYNQYMTEAEKFVDAVKQAVEFLDSYKKGG